MTDGRPLALVLLLTIALWTWLAHGDDQDLPTLLARAAVAEADFRPTDRAAMWHVHRKRAERDGRTIAADITGYVSMLKIHDHSQRARWVMELESSCSRPVDWDDAAGKWNLYQPKCLAVFEDARSFLAGTLADPCPRATQYGSPTLPSDVLRAARAVKAGRWISASCARSTAQVYFREVHR